MTDPTENSPDSPPPGAPGTPGDFMRLLTRHERPLAVYVYGLVPHLSDADDILQETKIVLWKQFGNFKAGTDFLAWSRKIAFHQVLNFRRGQKRRHHYSEAFLRSVASEIENESAFADPRSDHLAECLRKLSDGHRRLVLMRYFEDLGVEEIAEQVGKTPAAVYRTLSRIRRSLHDCLAKKLDPSPGFA